MSHVRVLVVEDEPIIAEDIREILHNMDFCVSGVAYNPEDAICALKVHPPDMVLLDINLGSKMDGIQIAEFINQTLQIPFVFLTSHADKVTVERAKHTHPSGYLVKPFDEKDLFTTLEIALFNYSKRSPKQDFSLDIINKKLLSKLTPKEFEIFISIYEGKTNRQMTEEYYVSLNTVKTHIKNLYDKLNVKTRTQAIAKLRALRS